MLDTPADACPSVVTPLTELFDLVAECGPMREIDAARCIDALIPLCEAGVREHPSFRHIPERNSSVCRFATVEYAHTACFYPTWRMRRVLGLSIPKRLAPSQWACFSLNTTYAFG